MTWEEFHELRWDGYISKLIIIGGIIKSQKKFFLSKQNRVKIFSVKS